MVGTVTAGVLASTGVAWYTAAQARTPAQRAAQTRPPADSVITAPVGPCPLTESVDLTGSLRVTGRIPVTGPASAAGASRAVVTKLPLAQGAKVRSGAVVAEISGRPVIVLPGAFPAYRDLTSGTAGPDVQQLQRALKQLYGTPVTGTFDRATTQAVRRLYRDAGYPTVDVPAPEQPGTAGGSAHSGASRPAAEGTGAPSAAATGPAAAVPVTTPSLPAAEVFFVPTLPATVSDVATKVGADAAGTLVTLATGGWEVVVPVQDSLGPALLGLTDRNKVTLGSGPAKGGDAHFRAIGPAEAATTPGGSAAGKDAPAGKAAADGAGTQQAVFALDAPPAGAVQGATQKLTVEVRSSSADCVVVPVSALWTGADGRPSVTVVAGAVRNRIAVDVGITVNGRVAVNAAATTLRPGAQVLVGYQDAAPGGSGGGDATGAAGG